MIFFLYPQAVPSRVPTGLFGPLPPQTCSLLFGWSNLASKRITVHPGIIDSNYKGEIQIMISSQILQQSKRWTKLLNYFFCLQFSSVQSLSCVQLFATPWIAACQASLSITNPQSSLKLMSIKSVMPSSHLILCRPLLILPPIPPSIRVFANESTLHMRWPKYWSLHFY